MTDKQYNEWERQQRRSDFLKDALLILLVCLPFFLAGLLGTCNKSFASGTLTEPASVQEADKAEGLPGVTILKSKTSRCIGQPAQL